MKHPAKNLLNLLIVLITSLILGYSLLNIEGKDLITQALGTTAIAAILRDIWYTISHYLNSY